MSRIAPTRGECVITAITVILVAAALGGLIGWVTQR